MLFKKPLLYIVILLGFAGPVLAQETSGESEIGGDKDSGFFSQYIYYDRGLIGITGRYIFFFEDFSERAEVAFGPTFNIYMAAVKLQAGVTTRQELMLAGIVNADVFGHGVVYFADAKFYTSQTRGDDTLYQKLFVRIDNAGRWQARVESLTRYLKHVYLRMGVEYKAVNLKKSYIYIAPFADPIRETFGAQGGFRFVF